MNIKLKYKIGDKLTNDSYIYTVIGFEYVESRGMRYIILAFEGSKTDWHYLYDFEIESAYKTIKK